MRHFSVLRGRKALKCRMMMLCPIPFGDFSYFLHIANPNTLLQRGDFVLLFRDKLLADEAFVAGPDDSLHDGRVIQLLRFVDFGATGTAASVDVREVFVVLLDVLDDVALHDLHVVDVVEQAEIGRAEAAAKLYAPDSMVAEVILVAHAVEELHREDNMVFLGCRQEAFQAFLTILPALEVCCAVASAGEANQVCQSGLSHLRDDFLVARHQLVVERRVVETPVDAQAGTLRHGDGQAVLFHDRPILRVEQFDGFNTDSLADFTKLVQRIFAEAPFTYRMTDIPLERSRSR